MAAWWAAYHRAGARGVLLADAALALVVGGLAAEGSWSSAAGHGIRLGWAGYALVALATAGLAVRRRWPLAALAVAYGAAVAYLAIGYPYGPVLQVASLAMYTVAAWCPRAVSLSALAVTVGGYLPLAWPTSLATAALWLGLPWVVGAVARGYRRIRARAAAAERRGDVYAERLRIAREVHDVVGHSLAVISMQAGVALHVLERRPDRAAESLRAVRETSAQALAELRATLSADDPPPGLDEVPGLVAAMRAGGLPVTLAVRGEPAAVPQAVALAGYRVVQESLTNVVRHAGDCRVSVRLEYRPDAVAVSVTDDGRGGPPAGTGRGLAGLRERAAAVGGTLAAGPGPACGFEVRALLPLGVRA